MPEPKPVVLTQADTNPSTYAPEPLVVVGAIPGGVEPQEAPSIDPSPADAAAVAADLQALVDALIDAGVLTD